MSCEREAHPVVVEGPIAGSRWLVELLEVHLHEDVVWGALMPQNLGYLVEDGYASILSGSPCARRRLPR